MTVEKPTPFDFAQSSTAAHMAPDARDEGEVAGLAVTWRRWR